MKNFIWCFCRVLKLWLNKQPFTNLPFFSVKFSDIKHIHNAMKQPYTIYLKSFLIFSNWRFFNDKIFSLLLYFFAPE